MKLSVIIPAYNEKDTIEVILQRVLEVKIETMAQEVIVVDRGSRDGTAGTTAILQGSSANRVGDF